MRNLYRDSMCTDRPNRNVEVLRNQQVRFHISDAYVPNPAQLLEKLHGQDLLQGRVIDVSDRGLEQSAFAVVEIEGLSELVVVPTAKIIGVED